MRLSCYLSSVAAGSYECGVVPDCLRFVEEGCFLSNFLRKEEFGLVSVGYSELAPVGMEAGMKGESGLRKRFILHLDSLSQLHHHASASIHSPHSGDGDWWMRTGGKGSKWDLLDLLH